MNENERWGREKIRLLVHTNPQKFIEIVAIIGKTVNS
jgi:hypothetical protein